MALHSLTANLQRFSNLLYTECTKLQAWLINDVAKELVTFRFKFVSFVHKTKHDHCLPNDSQIFCSRLNTVIGTSHMYANKHFKFDETILLRYIIFKFYANLYKYLSYIYCLQAI